MSPPTLHVNSDACKLRPSPEAGVEQTAVPEEKGGVQQVLADHFAKVYKVSVPLAA